MLQNRNRNHNNKVLANSNMDNNKDKTTCNHPIIVRIATNAELPHVVEISNNFKQHIDMSDHHRCHLHVPR